MSFDRVEPTSALEGRQRQYGRLRVDMRYKAFHLVLATPQTEDWPHLCSPLCSVLRSQYQLRAIEYLP